MHKQPDLLLNYADFFFVDITEDKPVRTTPAPPKSSGDRAPSKPTRAGEFVAFPEMIGPSSIRLFR